MEGWWRVSGRQGEGGGGNRPCRAEDEVAGASAKASRSRRTEEDCFRAELKREFCERLVSWRCGARVGSLTDHGTWRYYCFGGLFYSSAHCKGLGSRV